MRAYLSPIAMLVATALVASPLTAVAIPPPADESAPTKKREDPLIVLPTMRTLLGAAWLSQGEGFGDGLDSGFAFDLKVGALIAFEQGAGFVLWPELGYSYGGPPSRSRNLLSAGVGIQYGDGLTSWGWMPAFVVGTEGAETSYGMRNGLGARWLLFSAELSHTYMVVGGVSDQEIRITVGVDVLWSIGWLLFTDAFGSLF